MSQAQALKCQDCGALLRNVKEAQAHGEATGHANFAESTEKVRRVVCKECGKPCRSDTEVALHTQRTGHATFEDKTDEAVPALDTEAQMAEAKAELMEEAGLAPPPAAAAAAAAAAKEGGEGQAEDLVPAEVSPHLLAQLEEMGFGRARASRALHFSGGEALDAALTWLADHAEDADLDEEVLVPRAAVKVKLSPEEARAQAAELLRRAKERRERDERESERLREQERVRSGKELAAAARLEEELRVKRVAEERAREKAEEAAARAKIRAKLESDRRERRRAAGLPEELTPEEAEVERRKAEAAAAEEARRRLPVKPVAALDRLRALLVGMKKAHPGQDEAVALAFTTLAKFCSNVLSAPGEAKFRRVKLTNPAVAARVGAMAGGVEFLETCGFRRDASGEGLELADESLDLAVLRGAVEQLHGALTNPFFGVL